MKKFIDLIGELRPKNITIKGKSTIMDLNGKLVQIKEKNNNTNVKDIYNYLNSRNFNYFPNILNESNNHYMCEYIEGVYEPNEQKAFDMMMLLSLLHNKTTYYSEMDIDEYKKIYEETLYKIEDTLSFYNNLIDNIERRVYMSPSEYLIARNINKILGSLNYSKKEIDLWYELIKESPKKRVVALYNNVDINHVIRSKELYLINWDKSKMGIPIYDLYNFYIKHALEFDFKELLKFYEQKYPLLEEERQLFYIMISIPEQIEFTNNEFENTKKCKQIVELLYKSEILIFKDKEVNN